jgi:hypothetical protein
MIIYLEMEEDQLKWHKKEAMLACVQKLLPHSQTIILISLHF